MRLIKKAIYPLQLCYSIGLISDTKNVQHIVVAAEKHAPCCLFSLNGKFEQAIYEEPGGTMSIVPIEGKGGAFLASQRMYSPDDSLLSEIVYVSPTINGEWFVRSIAAIPFAHRFGVLRAHDGTQYLVISTLKSSHSYIGDWTTPGKYIAAKLPEDISKTTDLHWQVVVDGLFHNHGYCSRHDQNGDYSVVSAQTGIYEVHPPLIYDGKWDVRVLSKDPTSDIAFVDFDGDGQDEMITLSPFHGDTIRIYHMQATKQYQLYFEFPQKWTFVHAIFAGKVQGVPIAIIGHRGGVSRDLLGITYIDGIYKVEVLDKDCGSANVLYYRNGNEDWLVSANREKDEVAFYKIEV